MADHRYATSWRDLYAPSARGMLRSAAISGLATMQQISGRMDAMLHRPRVQVLILHHLFPDEEAKFRTLLASLKRDHQFIAYSEALRRTKAGGAQIDRPYIAITFDDGFRNCLRAATILEEFNAQGMFFVCPSIVGETDTSNIEHFCRERLELCRPVEFMNWDDLLSLRDRGHEIGGHTMSHVNLARAPIDVARKEITECRSAIQSRLGVCEHFAWTYGRFSDFSAELKKMVFDAGFKSCASGERGCHGPQRGGDGSTPLCVRRDHIVAGWPMKHSLYLLARSSANMTPESGAWPY